MIDHGHAIHYTTIERGASVFGSDGVEIGKVDHVVDNYREHILDGIIFETPEGELRFVDGPEVRRTAERGVTLAINSEEAAKLGPPAKAPPRFGPRRSRGRLSRLLGGRWRRH
jgi:hypothetical protein